MAEPQPKTKVAVKAKMQIDNHPANIEANFGDGFTLFLTQRAKLGTPISFCQWAQKSFNADIPLLKGLNIPSKPSNPTEQVDAVKKQLHSQGVPEFLQENLAKILLAEIWLDALVIDSKASAFQFGLTIDFKAGRSQGLEFLPNCALEEFQLLVTRAKEGYDFPERPSLPALPRLQESDQMVYDKVQFIGWAINTGPRRNVDRFEYVGMVDTNGEDIPRRVALVASVLNTAKTHDRVKQSEASTLKVFVMPEFFFRGKKGAYTMEQVHAVIKGLQDTVKGSEWKHWLFVFGTTIGYSYDDDKDDPLVDNTQEAQVYNFVLCQRGGFGDGLDAAPEAARIVMKEELSGIDFVRIPTAEGGMKAPDDYQAFLWERVKHMPAASPRGTGSEVSVKSYGGEGIFRACGFTWGVEICLDHHEAVHRLKSSTDLPNINFQLVPSCGMSIQEQSIVVKTGYIFNVDGLNKDGRAPNTAQNAHSELRTVKTSTGTNTGTNAPVDPVARVSLAGKIDVTNLYAGGEGDLHIYDAMPIVPA